MTLKRNVSTLEQNGPREQDLQKPTRNKRDIDSIYYNCSAAITHVLAEEGYVEEIFSEKEIMTRIQDYLTKNQENIVSFLGNTGKIFIPMNSAEVFADIITQALGVDSDRVTKFKISTYEKGVSTGKTLSENDKYKISHLMGLESGDKVLVIEDLIDTGHTLEMIDDFFMSQEIDVRALCLLDKHVSKGDRVKQKMGNRLESVIDIGQEFVIGFGMDYEHRLCADIPGLWKIKQEYIPEVIEVLNDAVEQIKYILNRPDTP